MTAQARGRDLAAGGLGATGWCWATSGSTASAPPDPGSGSTPPPDGLTAPTWPGSTCSIRPHEEVAIDAGRRLLAGRTRPASRRPSTTARGAAEAAGERLRNRLVPRARRPTGSSTPGSAAPVDLHMLTTDLPTGPYPYAGVPWFNTPFGRDGIITALQCLWLRPGAGPRRARLPGRHPGRRRSIPEQDAEPGKILHETRDGEMAALGEMPFGRYYGSVDATPAVRPAGRAPTTSGPADRAFVESLWPHVEAALGWIDAYGDRDGDGFVEYAAADGRRPGPPGLEGLRRRGLPRRRHAGRAARSPCARSRATSTPPAARRPCSAAALGDARTAPTSCSARRTAAGAIRGGVLVRGPRHLRPGAGRRQAALPGADLERRPLPASAASPRPTAPPRVARGMLSPDLVLRLGHPHAGRGRGAVQPDVLPQRLRLAARQRPDRLRGCARTGMPELAVRVLDGLFEAGTSFDLQPDAGAVLRVRAAARRGPDPYPVACAPQAWAAGSVFLLLQACLGLDVSGIERKVWFHRPLLPNSLPELRIMNLFVDGASLDLLLVRHRDDVGVNVLRRDGDFSIVVTK